MKAISLPIIPLLALSTALHAGEMFYTQRGADTLSTAGLDGSGVQNLIPNAGSNIRGVALDTGTDDLFYADNGADVIYRSRLDGSGRVTIVSGLNFPADIALDRTAGQLYFCDRNNNRIERCNYDGTGRQTITNSTEPYYLDLDLTNGKLYWGDFDDGNIFRADLANGLNQETFVSSNIETRGVKVDPSGGYVYWADRDSHKIQRRTIAGGPVEDLYTGLDTPHGITLDIPAGKVYWVDTGTNGVGGTGANAVSRGDMDGSGALEVLTAANGAWDITLDTRVSTYAAWIQRYFASTTAPTERLLYADPDGDGHTNLLEYFTGLPPLAAQAALPIDTLVTGGEVLTVYRKSHEPIIDALGVLEFSTDAENWQVGASVSEQASSGSSAAPPYTQVITERPLSPLADGGSVLSRLRIHLAIE